MSLFGGLIGGGLGLIGELIGGGEREEGVEAALEASRPISVTGPTGRAMFDEANRQFNLSLHPELRERLDELRAVSGGVLTDLGATDFAGREAAELDRLRTLRQPQIDQARSQLQSRLLARGRLGVGVGGGLGGRLFQPETAALEEAILRSDLGDIGAAREFARGDERFLLQQLQGLMGLESDIRSSPERLAGIGIQARPPAAVASMQALPGLQRGDFISGLFGGLGNVIGSRIPQVNFGGGLFL